MKESCCYQITISAESGNARVLKDIIHKPADLEMPKKVVGWCKQVGIETQVDFVIGFLKKDRVSSSPFMVKGFDSKK